ncbi:hypothetical protein JCM3774_005835 [Rhodotorula dairenensis]
MGPLATLFRRDSPTKQQQQQQQHSTLDVPLPTRAAPAPTTLGHERRFGPRLPRDLAAPTWSSLTDATRPAEPTSDPSRSGSTLPSSARLPTRATAPPQRDTLAQRVEALSLHRQDDQTLSPGASPAGVPFAPPAAALATSHSRPLVPFDAAVRAHRVASDASSWTTPPVLPMPCSPYERVVASTSAPRPPAVPPRPRPRVPTSSSSPATFARPAASRQPLGPSPPVPTPPPPRRALPHSNSAPGLFHPCVKPTSSPSLSAKPLSSLDENKLASPGGIGHSPASPSTAPSVMSPSRKKTRRASEPVSSLRSSPAAQRRAESAGSRQCDGITASSKRCTRMVSIAKWAARSPNDCESADTAGPVYCRQHAKLALVETGCFVKLGRAHEERWITFDDWIDPELPIETQALLRHYMSKPLSPHDQEGYIYVHELVPRSSNASAPAREPAALEPTAHIKLGRTLKPVARLSQWRATCPSREPIVRFVFPRAAPTCHGTSMHFAACGTRNHHRWERLCLVELAGRAIAPAEPDEKCADCGARHVECFRVNRRAVADPGGSGQSWDIVRVVEKWERWCRDVLG